MISSLCKYCNKPVHGRVDKLYCGDHCRAAFHNRERKTNYKNGYISKISEIIKKNRNILKYNIEREVDNINSNELMFMGFSFSFFTHETVSNSGRVYRFCYDYGYLINKGGKVKIIQMGESNCIRF